ncbi:hypothetical protein QBC35DRAFT_470565 [Podospora australis]|uniref:Uncharacterized protein n=1 Tax=Podospora australis TaxID=1536484 RepID=A0AAN6X2W8_9PEZI|nr:hypothetical protein QBC35DRAFT_470565 [Podospora australis]
MASVLHILAVISSFLVTLGSSQSLCGSLVTYRQYSVLLSTAPTCFLYGCGDPPPSSSMSSTCAVSQPCSKLWEFLRGDWQDNWCANCGTDVACRIPGWPILNMTATCSTEPQEWLFSNTGECCATGTEPFELADWIGSLCNGSEWRRPFAYYGYMAKEDWEEWIEPWNWTVRPENTSTFNLTGPPRCTDTHEMLVTFGIENAITSGEIVAGAFIFLIFAAYDKTEWFINKFRAPHINSFWQAVGSGIWYPLLNWVASSFWAAAEIRATPGYENVPIGFLALLFMARPNSLMLMTCALLWADRLIPSGWHPNPHFLPLPRNLGRQHASWYISVLGLSVSITEFIIQALGFYTIIKTTDQGVKKGFYTGDRLLPYWRGHEARIMYDGAMLHSIFAFITVGSLYVAAYTHKKESEAHRRLYEFFEWLNFQNWLNSRIEEQQQQQRQQQPAMGQVKIRGGSGSAAELIGVGDMEITQAQLVTTTPTRENQPGSSSSSSSSEDEVHYLLVDTIFLRFYVWLERGVPQPMVQRYPALEQAAQEEYPPPPRGEDPPDWAAPALALTTFCAVINYIAQWLFWAGFVKSQGQRYCVPDDPFLVRTIRLIFWLLPLAGILPTTLLSAAETNGLIQAQNAVAGG